MGGGMIVLRSLKTKGNKNIFQLGRKMTPLYFAKNSYSKIWSINSDSDGFMCWSWAKMAKIYSA